MLINFTYPVHSRTATVVVLQSDLLLVSLLICGVIIYKKIKFIEMITKKLRTYQETSNRD